MRMRSWGSSPYDFAAPIGPPAKTAGRRILAHGRSCKHWLIHLNCRSERQRLVPFSRVLAEPICQTFFAALGAGLFAWFMHREIDRVPDTTQSRTKLLGPEQRKIGGFPFDTARFVTWSIPDPDHCPPQFARSIDGCFSQCREARRQTGRRPEGIDKYREVLKLSHRLSVSPPNPR